MTWLAVALGGAMGAMCRYAITTYGLPMTPGGFPWATLVANVVGSTIMGILYVLIMEKGMIPMAYRPLLMVGFLGALTTFSTFSLDAWLLWQVGQTVTALIYVVSSVLMSLIGVVIGITSMKYLLT